MEFVCDLCDRIFESKKSLSNHRRCHNPEFREKISKTLKDVFSKPEAKEKRSKASKDVWNRPGYRKKMNKILKEAQNRPEVRAKNSETSKGKNNGMYGRYKENTTYSHNHKWIRTFYPPKEICNNKCEVCGEFRLDLQLAQFLHINKRNIEDPMIDYMYICPNPRKKNSCHNIYDELSGNEKEILLEGAITREEKLKKIKEYILKIKVEVI